MSKIRWQCRRGMLELDFIFERFLNTRYDQLSDEKKELFSRLLEQDDPILFDWLVAEIPCTDEALCAIVQEIKKRP